MKENKQDYSLKTKVIKQGGSNKVMFSIGVQYFTLDYEGTKAECKWIIRMLRTAFKNYDKRKSV